MKKTLLALSALAACGAAMAQSTVTIYGIADVYAGSLKNGLSTKSDDAPKSTAVKQTAVNSGGLSTSRWGMRGSEDLGNGMKANFQLEQAVTMDTGAATGFTRQSWVGLSGSFGEVKLGRTYTPYHTFRGLVNNTNDFNLSVTGDVAKAAGGDYNNGYDNQIQYASPSFNGVTASIAVAMGEDKGEDLGGGLKSKNASDTVSLAVRYTQGPITVGFAHQAEGQKKDAADIKYNLFGGTYDLGVAKLQAFYNTAKRPALNATPKAEDKEYQLGVSAPVAPGVTLYAGYAKAETKIAGTVTEKADGYNLLATYDLSKRSSVYAGWKDAKEKDGAGAKKGELKQVALGLRHTF